MKQQSFERSNETRWVEFGALIKTVQHGYRLGDSSRSNEFLELYQQITRDLALAKTRGYSRSLVSRLNILVRAGHNVIYVKRSGMGRAVLEFVFTGFPCAVRRQWRYFVVSTLLFVVPLVGLGIMTYTEPDTIYSVMSERQVSSVENMYDPTLRKLGRERQSDSDFSMFGFYIMNNISISFQVFATGILFGLGTVFYLVFNGVQIGAVSGHLLMLGFDETFLPFVVGHGAFELTAIIIAGAAGLLIGHALIAPDNLPRVKKLALNSRIAIELVMGAAGMLVIAAFLEAFWSSSTVLPNVVKYSAGALFWLFVILYLVLAGRNRESG